MLLLSARHKEGDDASASLGCEGILIFIHSLYHELLSENWLQRISGRERWKEKKRKMFVVVVKKFYALLCFGTQSRENSCSSRGRIPAASSRCEMHKFHSIAFSLVCPSQQAAAAGKAQKARCRNFNLSALHSAVLCCSYTHILEGEAEGKKGQKAPSTTHGDEGSKWTNQSPSDI